MNREPRLLLEWEPRWRSFLAAIGPALRRAPRPHRQWLLVDWEPRWRGFVSAMRPALGRSQRHLEGECPVGLFSRHGAALSVAAHFSIIAALVFLPQRLARPSLLQAQTDPRYDVIYYSGPYLPQTEDAGGADAGREGRSGGDEAFHPTQVMRVARENRVTESVAEAPKLRLPRTLDAANLLAFAPAQPGPAPAEALRSMAKPTSLSAEVVAPAPDITLDRAAVAPQLGVAVVQPAPAIPARNVTAPQFAPDVIAPPVSAPVRDTTTEARLSLPAPQIVAPPPTDVPREARAIAGTGLGLTTAMDVIAPPVNPGGRSLAATATRGLGQSTVVAPAPTVTGGAVAINAKSKTGAGFGDTGFVLSMKPGNSVGLPATASSGSVAMSPDGNGKAGFGGSGGGLGTGVGSGSGRGATGNGPGMTTAGNGHGFDPLARGGTSAAPGPGGSGLGGANQGGIAGVTIRGGTVTLPSFGNSEAPDIPARSSDQRTQGAPDITIVGSSRSGGALNAYGMLKGSKVYTIYLETRLGPAVLEYAEHTASQDEFEADLTAPQAVNTNLPAGLNKAKFVVACVIDRAGALKDFRVLENTGLETTAILSAIHDWRFRPVLRGQQAVEVDAILGFGVSTR